MTTPPLATETARLVAGLAAAAPSARLQAAMLLGTRPDPRVIEALVARLGVEPDFFVRDMLTWAPTRHPVADVLPRLVAELDSATAQARSQALHTLSKLQHPDLWGLLPWPRLLHDPDDEVARVAWRTAVAAAPPERETELAAALMQELGRGSHETQLSLSRALVALGDTMRPMLAEALTSTEPHIRAHARATEVLRRNPDADVAVDEAIRVAITNAAPQGD